MGSAYLLFPYDAIYSKLPGTGKLVSMVKAKPRAKKFFSDSGK